MTRMSGWGSPAVDARRLMEYDARRKSPGAAYLLWLLLGLVGGHRFYAGRWFSGFIMASIFLLSWLLTLIWIGWIGVVFVGFWWLVDGLLVGGWIRDHNLRVMSRIS